MSHGLSLFLGGLYLASISPQTFHLGQFHPNYLAYGNFLLNHQEGLLELLIPLHLHRFHSSSNFYDLSGEMLEPYLLEYRPVW